jgi:hypothetical protein
VTLEDAMQLAMARSLGFRVVIVGGEPGRRYVLQAYRKNPRIVGWTNAIGAKAFRIRKGSRYHWERIPFMYDPEFHAGRDGRGP